MKIGTHLTGGQSVFVIAEIGNNHNGSFDLAVEMVDAAINVGADCVKFQMRDLGSLYTKASLTKDGTDLGTEYIIDLLNRFELSYTEHKKISEYCREKGIIYMCTPWDEKSLLLLEDLDVPAYKVASADLTNLNLIAAIIKTKKPIILSTGMSTEQEIKVTTNFLNSHKANFTLLHCNSTYPAPFHDINLSWLTRLKEIHPNIGYSGHERGIAVSLGAVAMGAKILERHFTFDRNMEGPDHAASLEPKEFLTLVQGVREIEVALGRGDKKILSQGEMINRENLSKSLVAASDLSKGMVIEKEHIKVLSPGQGLSVQHLDNLVGKKLMGFEGRGLLLRNRSFRKIIAPTNYKFKRPWGYQPAIMTLIILKP